MGAAVAGSYKYHIGELSERRGRDAPFLFGLEGDISLRRGGDISLLEGEISLIVKE